MVDIVFFVCLTELSPGSSSIEDRWKFTKSVDANVRWLSPETKKYDRFVGFLIEVAMKHIPNRFRKSYIPTWKRDLESCILLDNFNTARKEH